MLARPSALEDLEVIRNTKIINTKKIISENRK